MGLNIPDAVATPEQVKTSVSLEEISSFFVKVNKSVTHSITSFRLNNPNRLDNPNAASFIKSPTVNSLFL